MSASSRVAQVALLGAGAVIGMTCTGSSGGPGTTTPVPEAASADASPAAPVVASGDTAAAAAKPALSAPNNPPTLEIPAYEIAGVGQEIAFGIEVIDAESDDFSVEMLEKPASASYDPYTLTVVWKPTRKDMPQGEFAVRITETRRDTGAVRANVHRFGIAVSARKQPEPHAQPLSPAVETLITIHDPDRLAAVNKKWTLDKVLRRSAEMVHARLPEAERTATKVADDAALYRAFLQQIARAHDNPAVDPTSDQFDKAAFGNPKDWKIIAVRPRLDKKWHELRIVFQAKKSPAATYTMFRFRPTDDAAPPDVLPFNNRVFSQLVFDALFTGDGDLEPKFARDKKAHGKAVEKLVTATLEYASDDNEWAGASFLALPTEARLGGGSRRGADGSYASGDGWGWNVMKFKPHDGVIEPANVPIKGFVSGLRASDDGAHWEMTCGPRFNPNDDAHLPGYAGLCRETGHTDLPGTGDGYTDSETTEGGAIVSAFVDAANMFVTHKNEHIVATVELRDPRRDLFEEKGMTCSQCHVRQFGVRDMYDATAYDPRAGTPKAGNKDQAPTYFVIVPTVRWQPYAIDFQHKQECKFKVAFETDLGKQTSLTCPLKAE